MKPIHKFNNGNGATLCHKCSAIISIGFTDDLYCKECRKETLEEYAERRFPSKMEMYEVLIEGAKWQQEQDNNKYSEEDIMFAYEQGARLALISQSPLALHKGDFPTPKEWFEQFKKK